MVWAHTCFLSLSFYPWAHWAGIGMAHEKDFLTYTGHQVAQIIVHLIIKCFLWRKWRDLTNYLWGKVRCPSPLLKKYLISSASPGYSNTLSTWCKEPTHLKRPWCWERLKAGEGADRGWDGWMASPIQWTWVWVNSGSWWWTGRPGVLQSMGWQRVRHNWATELNWNPGLAWQH